MDNSIHATWYTDVDALTRSRAFLLSSLMHYACLPLRSKNGELEEQEQFNVMLRTDRLADQRNLHEVSIGILT